jgi:hypothetical protein
MTPRTRTDDMTSDKLLEEASEYLAAAHEAVRKPWIAIDIRTGNVGRQGVMWVETTTALAALQNALRARSQEGSSNVR